MWLIYFDLQCVGFAGGGDGLIYEQFGPRSPEWNDPHPFPKFCLFGHRRHDFGHVLFTLVCAPRVHLRRHAGTPAIIGLDADGGEDAL